MSRFLPPEKAGDRYTIKSLRLDLKEAHAGRTWLLLPEGYRESQDGMTYPLPSRRLELQKLSCIDIPPHTDKRDCGCLYIRRAIKKWKHQQRGVNSAILDVGQRQNAIRRSHHLYSAEIKGLKADARRAVDEVREEAVQAIANLSDLFSLGREGIEGQMRAYLNDEEYKGEKINKKDFQANFRMVTQAVKGLGLPSDQKKPASEAVVEEVAAAIRSTQETLELAPSPEPDPETIN